MNNRLGLCVEFLKEDLGNLSIAPSKHKLSQLGILNDLCQEHINRLDLASAKGGLSLEDHTTICSDILNSILSNAVEIGDKSAISRDSYIIIDQATDLMMDTLISMIKCLIDGSNRIPVTILSVIYDNQIRVVSTMLNSGWGEKLPNIWMVFKEILRKKQEVLDTFEKARYINHPNPCMFLESLHSWSQFQGENLRKCVSISVGYEIVMPAIEDAWRTLFDLERYVLEKIMLEEKDL